MIFGTMGKGTIPQQYNSKVCNLKYPYHIGHIQSIQAVNLVITEPYYVYMFLYSSLYIQHIVMFGYLILFSSMYILS